MTFLQAIILLFTAFVGAVGQFFLKAGAVKIDTITATDILAKTWGVLTIPELLFGMFCYGLGSVGYVSLLTRVPLSVVGPSIALGYVFSVLIGYFWFREPVSISKLVGLVMVFGGVIILITSTKR